jgi:NitT/TauT family transport system ATP-binding protein
MAKARAMADESAPLFGPAAETSPASVREDLTPSPKLRIRDVEMTYATRDGEIAALAGVSLDIQAGEVVAVVGVSGCGKSTLLHIIAGLLTPTTGEVSMDGVAIRGPDPSRGVVFQSDAIYPWMTVAENVAYGLRHRAGSRLSRREREEKVRESLRQVDLDGHDQLYPRELSGGMRKRVEIARAYAPDPEVLLLDEPFGALDALTKEALQVDLAKRLESDASRTVFLVTHDIEEAVFLADRVVVMTSRPGEIAADVSVPFPRPRTSDVIATEDFQRLRYELRGYLKVEVK